MTSQFLHDVLEAIGYLVDGRPAHGVRMSDDVHVGDQTCGFRADALWKGDSTFTVYFKPGPKVPSGERIAGWHREIWNRGGRAAAVGDFAGEGRALQQLWPTPAVGGCLRTSYVEL